MNGESNGNELISSKLQNEAIKIKNQYNNSIASNTLRKLSKLNDDLSRNEQLSGLYYLKNDITMMNTLEIFQNNRRGVEYELKNEKIISNDVKQAIVQRNDSILGLNRNNSNNNNNMLLHKRKQIENYRIKNSISELTVKSQHDSETTTTTATTTNKTTTSNATINCDSLLPPNFRAYLAKRNQIIQSPFRRVSNDANNNQISYTNVNYNLKNPTRFYANSKPLLNATLLPSANSRLKNKNNDSDSDDDKNSLSDDDSGESLTASDD